MRIAIVAFLAVILCGLGVTHLAAQGTTATILGTVTDATGASIPGAMVQVKNVGTGQTQTVQSDAPGRYRVPDLIVGDYEVTGHPKRICDGAPQRNHPHCREPECGRLFRSPSGRRSRP